MLELLYIHLFYELFTSTSKEGKFYSDTQTECYLYVVSSKSLSISPWDKDEYLNAMFRMHQKYNIYIFCGELGMSICLKGAT